MRRVSVVLVLFAPFAALPSTTNADAPKATITFRVHHCPHGFVHQEFSKVCESRLIADAYVALFSKPTGLLRVQVDADGAITFQVPEGDYTYEGPSGEVLSDRYMTCVPGDPDRLNRESFALQGGEIVVCDVYLVFSSLCGACPPTPTPLPGAGHIKRFWALLCDHDPGVIDQINGALPSGCTLPSGISLNITTGDGKPIGTCVTELGGYCELHVVQSVVIVTEDLDGVPFGYAPPANPMLQSPGSVPAIIVNVPVSTLPTIAPADSSITLHSLICPFNHYTVENCQGHVPDYPQMFFLTGQFGGADALAKTVDEHGDVTFSKLLPESYILQVVLPEDLNRGLFQCSRSSEPDVVMELGGAYAPGWAAVTIPLGPGEAISCNVFAFYPVH